MVNHADENGIVIFTCATKGRLEHGTHRTDPASSPGTASKDNSYYKNLVERDFLNIPNFHKNFVSYQFFTNHLTKDLYFYGLRGNKKIDTNSVVNFFKDATDIATKIRKKENFKSYIKIRIIYLLLVPLYGYLSEDNYQNFTYKTYK